ncbi:MAG TPA: FAD-binding oxidoreductase [Acidimicrobiia bacterium]|nr:FAD-binding oxidoreductase [Acidimicrobiia bacterium]
MAAARFSIPGFSGELIHPDDASYDEARALFNGMIDRRPALIARCTSNEDVAAAVKFATAENLPMSVYGGGHGVTGAAVVDAGVVVDLRTMHSVTVDPNARVARVEGGATWGEFDAATAEHGLVSTGGRVSTTGVGGLTLGSGSGWLERKFGFVCDNLVKAEVVTADGRIVTASADENADLFWGLRGGGANFGVVTAFHIRVHELGPIVYGGLLMFPAPAGRDLLRAFRDFMLNAPDEVGAGLAFISAPPEDFVPEPVRGMPVIGVLCCYAGPVEEGEAAYKPLRDLGPALDMVAPMPYVAVQQLLDPSAPKGMQNYWTANFYDSLPDEAVDILVERATQPVSPLSQVLVVPGGGALSRVSDDETAFGQRNAPWNLHFLSMWPDPADTEKNIKYTRDIANAMDKWSTGRAYLNFIGDEGVGRVEAAFGPEKYKKLQALKTKWDPDNVFRHNQNITPA